MFKKTIDSINEKIKKGNAVVLTAEEILKMKTSYNIKEISKKVDIVTTGTFGAMCSSGVFMNFGHPKIPIRMEKVKLNGVLAHSGLAAVDVFLGAASVSKDNPTYGGAHIIEELLDGKDIKLEAEAKGTDCYPQKKLSMYLNINDLNECYLYNPRNCYQNYAAAVNSSNKSIYTYMGKLLPKFGNLTYSTSGELSPLLNDPELETIGIGTKILLGGAKGFISWQGTQYNTKIKTNKFNIPVAPARTLALTGNLKKMNSNFIKAAYFKNYGVTIYIGVAVPIPILNERILENVLVSNEEIETIICDYSKSKHPVIGKTNYKNLRTGKIKLNNKNIKTSSLSSLFKARQIAEELKDKILNKDFYLTKPVKKLPKKSIFKNLKIRKKRNKKTVDKKSKKITAKKLKFEYGKCISCGACISLCNTRALHFNKVNKLVFEKDLCSNCYECVDACPLELFKIKE